MIIEHKGNIYTLVTNGHVVCGGQRCSELPSEESYRLGLADGQYYRVKGSNIKLLGNDLDLAIIQFRSNHNYAVAKLSSPGSLRVTDQVYTAGFPFEQPGFRFGEGNAIAVVNKRLTDDAGGYTVIYDAPTLPGMSGGGVFDKNGLLVAIHGQGDRFQENTEVEDQSRIGQKIGFNRGISVSWLVQSLAEVGTSISGTRSVSSIRGARPQVSASADEHFVAGFNKLITPGDNVLAGKRLAIQKFSKAIQLNPKYGNAYFQRAYVYEQLQEFPRSLADYTQAILINPKDAQAHNNRGMLKADKLNDSKGALADYNQAISIDPQHAEAYNNRAILKKSKLNNVPGALADYNQAISINPQDVQAYGARGLLKYTKLNDRIGGIADMHQAAKKAKAQGNTELLQIAMRTLKEWNVRE